ncbi:argininosuccinate synthase [Candidatus Kaiserbacteria bacterium RIFCSPLOWO2_01_FULL_54_20]|uniref:Argininosuccinate synthase n=1 Tax=Candidatus Kaiserbacteria bacterium RIFCSPLOWO2_01_FULL_54_20 TaxID=1798513 RepID=A0A1F6EJW3_9BACT|nr:MAG: argininosuccinate synthase [Candidatus Kaiserbacteria bacterium RIFCSPLOWO2_01_FULL_54_20]
MDNKQTYQKVASYEVKEGKIDRVLLLYSGGLDTSVMLKWLQDSYGAKVTALTLDIGQQNDDLDFIKKKALKLGAEDAIVYDAKKEFAEDFIAKGIKANASYQGEYHLSTPMGRALTAKIGVQVARKKGITCIAHGCTGKGNDQVRFDGYITALDASMKVIAPVREWNMDRKEEISYALKNKIPVPVKKDFPYSVDDNMWGMTWEGGEIESPKLEPRVKKFLTTYTRPENAPASPTKVKLAFKNGLPTKLNGKSLPLAQIIMRLNKIGGAHGVGVVYMIEDRLIGLKDRGVYEQPGGHCIIEAHRALERFVSTRDLNEIKSQLDVKWGYLCYGAKWYDPAMDAINAFNEEMNEKVSGEVTLELYRGNVNVVALSSPYAMGHASFNVKEGYKYNVNASAGFVEVYTLQMKIANEIARKNKRKK